MVYGGMEKPKDYYQLLGVPRDASLTAIRRAFQKLARRLEPERAEDGFAELQAAYETLTDAERRRRYDDELGGADRPAPLDWSFMRRPAAGDLRRPLAPTSLTAEIVLRPEEAAAGTVLSLDVPVTGAVRRLLGHGREPVRLRPLRRRGPGDPPHAGAGARARRAARGLGVPGAHRRARRAHDPADRPPAPGLTLSWGVLRRTPQIPARSRE